MSDRFVNLEIGGIPVVMYGMIGLTTVVIAYATVSGAFGSSAASSVGMPAESVFSPVEESPASTTEGGAKRALKKNGSKKKRESKKHRKTPRRK